MKHTHKLHRLQSRISKLLLALQLQQPQLQPATNRSSSFYPVSFGSGKSTFARALVDHYPNWRRCKQDELGDRHAVLFAARTALLAGQNVVIDRTNIDAKQRRTWLELARDSTLQKANPGERSLRCR